MTPEEQIRSVPSFVEKDWTPEEHAASEALMKQINAWCEYKKYYDFVAEDGKGWTINPFGILIMGYGNGVWMNCVRAALAAAEKAKNP